MTTHKTYRKEVRFAGTSYQETVLYPVRRDSDDHLSWEPFRGQDAGFVCWCGQPIASFTDAVALADTI